MFVGGVLLGGWLGAWMDDDAANSLPRSACLDGGVRWTVLRLDENCSALDRFILVATLPFLLFFSKSLGCMAQI